MLFTVAMKNFPLRFFTVLMELMKTREYVRHGECSVRKVSKNQKVQLPHKSIHLPRYKLRKFLKKNAIALIFFPNVRIDLPHETAYHLHLLEK